MARSFSWGPLTWYPNVPYLYTVRYHFPDLGVPGTGFHVLTRRTEFAIFGSPCRPGFMSWHGHLCLPDFGVNVDRVSCPDMEKPTLAELSGVPASPTPMSPDFGVDVDLGFMSRYGKTKISRTFGCYSCLTPMIFLVLWYTPTHKNRSHNFSNG